MTNVPGRRFISLNGNWQTIIDWYNNGVKSGIFKDEIPKDKIGFNEYGFGNQMLKVPSDWNSQDPKLFYYEGTIWYKKEFIYQPTTNKRTFIYFGAVNYKADVYLNGKKLGSHEGGFTPFQFEVTNLLLPGANKLILIVNNERRVDGIPALSFDWWNYGGITRDVSLIETPETYIDDYFIQLKKGSKDEIEGWVKLKGKQLEDKITLTIPEANITKTFQTNAEGYAPISFKANLNLWSPGNPKLYAVSIFSAKDQIIENIGFRTIEVKGTEILVNGKPVFLKGISFHEEIPQDKRRAVSEADALQLLTAVKALGCNFVRLAHYPQNEYTVRMAEKMGIMLWEEIPVWQGIQFSNPVIISKAETMLKEMIQRDKNRCSIIIWSLSNETAPSPDRNRVLTDMAAICRRMDPTRLLSSAFDHFKYEGNKIIIDDSLSNVLDVIAANKYMGWYMAWPKEPGNVIWKSSFNKPLIMSEFGGEAKYGNHGTADTANLWNEEYQEQLYKDNITMFLKIPFLRGTCPWILEDFRTPFRMQPVYQDGWNRKGLLSDKGEKKKAWYIIKAFYDNIESFQKQDFK
jgi:beta-glucuronidase